MRTQAVRARVLRALARHLDLDVGDLHDDLRLGDDLGLTEIERLEVVVAMEAALGVHAREAEALRVASCGDLIDLGATLLAREARHAVAATLPPPRVWIRLVPHGARWVRDWCGRLTDCIAEAVVAESIAAGTHARLDAVLHPEATTEAVRHLEHVLAPVRRRGVLVSVTRGAGLPAPRDHAHHPDARRLCTLAELVAHLGTTLHELQHERALTASHLASGGRKVGDALTTQRQRTDGAADGLRAFLAACHPRLPMAVRTRVTAAETALGRLPALRGRACPAHDGAAALLAGFVAVDDTLLGATEAIASVGRDAEWGRLAQAYVALLRAKETAAAERSQLATALESGRGLPPGSDVALASLIAAQQSFLALFVATARPKAVAVWRRTANDGAFRESAHLERLALEHPDQPLDADRVFAAMARKHDRLREVEAAHLEALVEHAAIAAAGTA